MLAQSKGPYTESGLITGSGGWYFGFSAKTEGESFSLKIWDGVTTAGQLVEDYAIDGEKTMEVHERSVPIYCSSGLLIGISKGSALVFFKEN